MFGKIPGLKLAIYLSLLSVLLLANTEACFAQKYGKPQVDAASVESFEDPNVFKQQAFDEYLAGEFESSADLYLKAIESGSKKYGDKSKFVADLYYELGTMSLEEGNFTRAAHYLPMAVQLKPNSEMARVKLADLYLMQGKLDEAFGEIFEAQKRNPGSVAAQKQLVKLMMERAKKNNSNSSLANLACTAEAFRLTNFSNNLLRNTNNLIANWQKRITSGKNYIPTLSIAMTSSSRLNVAKPVKKKPSKIKPPQKSTKKPRPVAKAKPKPKKKAAPKRKKKTRTVVAKKAPAKKKTKRIAKSKNTRRPYRKVNGLVPPPPPIPPIIRRPAIQLKTEAKVQKKAKEKPKKKKKKKKKKIQIPDEPDFILDWAAKKGKKSK